MDPRILDIQEDIREIKTDVREITRQGHENTRSLVEHMVRTELNERRIQTLEKWQLGVLTSVVLGVGTLVVRSFL